MAVVFDLKSCTGTAVSIIGTGLAVGEEQDTSTEVARQVSAVGRSWLFELDDSPR